MQKLFLPLLFLPLLFYSCHRASTQLEPVITLPDHPKEIYRENRSFASYTPPTASPFPPLTTEEAQTDWGKEMQIGKAFASDFDLFRAITSFKRALFFIPSSHLDRKLEIEYELMLSYYLGKKYKEALFQFESTELLTVDGAFAPFHDLLLILYDCYAQEGNADRAGQIFNLIAQEFPEEAERLSLLTAIKSADLCYLSDYGKKKPSCSYLENIVENYSLSSKSVRKAEFLNAVLPGAGYWYVGQKQTAITAFLINSLFIAASVEFFIHDNIPAGAIFATLESGWYFGGIYGAGLAAKTYNECLYGTYAGKILRKEQCFPLFMINYSF